MGRRNCKLGFSSYLPCTVIVGLLVYNKDSALNTFCLLTFQSWLLQNDTVLQKPDCVSRRVCFMLTSLQLWTSKQKPLQDPISKQFNFYLQLHIPCTFHWSLLGEPVKATSENTQSWQHRTGGSQFKSHNQNSAQNDKLWIYLLPWR